jgi:diaminopimelate decarboxylase
LYELFPINSGVSENGRLCVAGLDLSELASIWGTPLYVYDAVTLRSQVDHLQSLLLNH